MIQYKKNDSKISIDKKNILLPGPIWQVFEYQNFVLVVLDPDFGMRNVFCYNQLGELLWTIARAEFFKTDGQGYDGIYLGSVAQFKDRLIVSSRGRPFYLAIETGDVNIVPDVPDRM